MELLSKDTFLSRVDLRKERVEITGGYVYVRNMTGEGLSIYQDKVFRNNDKKQDIDMQMMMPVLVVLTVCDEQGNLLFTMDDMSEIMKKDGMDLRKIFRAALDLNGIGSTEEMTKNSVGGQTDGSSST